ncbi:hypothetical protein [uncultured Roseobacter sp.]|uniref:hypothetical protein n=1 Tax=uncultured Roseobacter sp. TaxID=114847 RepID=UPI0026055B28|nr:hypothetical protein [uncultured Roseobacter sp.]
MPRTVWTKLQSDPNGNWELHEGEAPFSISVTGGLTYDVRTDGGRTFVITPLVENPDPTTIITPDPDEISVEALAPLPNRPELFATPSVNTIIVEIA